MIEEIIKRYKETEELKTQSHPRVLFKDTLYDWSKSTLYTRTLPLTILDCTYKIGLLAEGHLTGKEDDKDRSNNPELKKTLLKSKKSIANIPSLHIPGHYKGIYFSGEAGNCVLSKGELISTDEWIFSDKERITNQDEVQSILDLYFLSKLFNRLDFPYTIIVRDKSKVHRRDLNFWIRGGYDFIDRYVVASKEGVFTGERTRKAELYLDSIARIFNAEVDCAEKPLGNCSWNCREKSVCPHYSSFH